MDYVRAFYFSVVTMVTVGYGDIHPVNADEMLLCVFTIMISCCVFGYSLNMIGAIVQDFFARELEIAKSLRIIDHYMQKKGIDKNL